MTRREICSDVAVSGASYRFVWTGSSILHDLGLLLRCRQRASPVMMVDEIEHEDSESWGFNPGVAPEDGEPAVADDGAAEDTQDAAEAPEALRDEVGSERLTPPLRAAARGRPARHGREES